MLLTTVAAWPTSARATLVTLTSVPFSMGYGSTAQNPNTWTTVETATVNTATTQGDFSFVPTASGPKFSGSGPKFPNRVLSDGLNGYDTSFSGWSWNFSLSIAGAYNATLPAGAYNVQLTLDLTEISLYGLKYLAFGTGTMQFQEITVEHSSSSSILTMNEAGDNTNPLSPYRTASNWKQLTWNPSDFAVAGTVSTRTFNLGTFSSTTGYGIDGLEVEGLVTLTYEIPEPASLVMLALGAALALPRRNRPGR